MKLSPTSAAAEAQGIAPGNMSRRPEDHGIQVLAFDTYFAVVIIEAKGGRWLIKEEVGDYGPQNRHEAEALIPGCTGSDYDGDFPFCTQGTHWIVDVNSGLGSTVPFEAGDQEIQGVTYALEALMHGGILEPKVYAEYINGLVEELDEHFLCTDPEFDSLRAEYASS